jgi:hypothetical protein
MSPLTSLTSDFAAGLTRATFNSASWPTISTFIGITGRLPMLQPAFLRATVSSTSTRPAPVHQLGGPADTGIEAVTRVKAAIVIDQRRFRLVEVANIMFGRVLRTARVQQFPHTMLEFHRVIRGAAQRSRSPKRTHISGRAKLNSQTLIVFLPAKATVCRWLARNQEFRRWYALARACQVEDFADEYYRRSSFCYPQPCLASLLLAS